jgi:hypothetical protein
VLPALLLAVALILASCGGSGSTQQETESGSAQEETQETTGGMAEMDTTQRIQAPERQPPRCWFRTGSTLTSVS